MSANPSPQQNFKRQLDARLTSFLSDQRHAVAAISRDAAPLVDAIADLTRGGKRLRPLFAFWGAAAAGGVEREEELATLGAALELFQAAALIHDDIIDHSDTRRGRPSVHRAFEATHRDGEWDLDPVSFGEASAILAGDLALSMSEQLFAAASPTASARRLFDAMRLQVMAGQYLDVLEEQIGSRRAPHDAAAAAGTVVRYKSAKYSVENPVLLGAAQAGASEDELTALSTFALPLGEAFQLRDDELGVFGDPATTGKPAGDDLREGKRTLLVALTLKAATPEQAEEVNSALGNSELSDADVERLRSIMRETGALDALETTIESLTAQAFSALDALEVNEAARDGLRSAGLAAVRRVA